MASTQNTVIISVNPKAGRRSPMERAEKLQTLLQNQGLNVILLTDLDEVAKMANTFHAEGSLRVLVGVGGDGTAATLVNLIQPGVPITLLSAGTANLLAKHFRLGRTPEKLASVILTGKTITLDAGKVLSSASSANDATEQNGKQSNGNGRLFLVMVSCGFDADIVHGVHARREERYRGGHPHGAHISYFSYLKPIFKSLFGYRFAKMKIERFDGKDWHEISNQSRWAFFFNINRYGWGLPLAPYAKENDGLLDHVLFRGGTTIHGLFYVAAAQCFSLHRFFARKMMGQATKYRVTSDKPVPVQLDGDPCGCVTPTEPMEIAVIPNRLTFLVPKTYNK